MQIDLVKKDRHHSSLSLRAKLLGIFHMCLKHDSLSKSLKSRKQKSDEGERCGRNLRPAKEPFGNNIIPLFNRSNSVKSNRYSISH